jgi:F-type H+-transporting ATPase subunit b
MGSLGVDGWKLISQIVAFLIFIYLFWRFALGPIVKVMDERQSRIRESIESADRMQKELQATAARNEEVIAEARQQAQEILKASREQGDALVARATEEAAKKGDEFLARAQNELRAATEQARLQLRQEVADLAVRAATRIVKKELDPATQSRLIEETLAEAAGGSSTGPVA